MISILYVDDESALLEITKIYMERTGEFKVETCPSAKDAIEALSRHPYDAVVSDYQMPEMDGLEFLHYLRQRYDTLPFILFTGKGREEVAIEALNSGADFYLQKGGEPKSQFAELKNKILQAVNRQRAEKALRESEEKYRVIVDNAPIGIFHSTPEGQLIDVNPVYARMFGYASPDEMIAEVNRAGMAEALYPSPGQRDEIIHDVLAAGGWQTFDTPYRKKDGTRFQSLLSFRSYLNPASGKTEFEGFVIDITENRKAEARIAAGEQRYHNIFDAAGDAMLVLDYDTGAILDANPAAVRMFQYTVDELRHMEHKDLSSDPSAADRPDTCQTLHQPKFPYRRKDGTVFAAETTATHYPQKKHTICIVSIRDITERKRAEEQADAARRLYIVLSQINQSIVRVRNLETLLSDICRIAVEYGKFRMAWVALFDKESKSIRPVAHAGAEDGYLSSIEIRIGDDTPGSGPTGRVIQTGTYDICNDIATDPRMEPWRDEALKRGYRSSAAFPIRLHGAVVGAITIYAGEPAFFTGTEINLMDEIAMDVSFALDMLDEQARRTQAETALTGSEERAKFLADVLEHSSQPFAIAYPDGRIGIANPAFCNLVGYTDTELRTLTTTAITPPEFHEREAELIRELDRTGIPQRYEKEYLRKDGSRVPVEMFTHRAMDTAGEMLYRYAFVTDITERRLAQEAIRAERDLAQRYLDVAGVMIAVIDRAGTVTLINRRGAEILGYAEEECLGKNWGDTFLPERIRSEVNDVLDRIMNGEVAPFEYHENALLTRNGTERLIAFHNTLLTGPDGGIIGILFSGQDITLRKEMEEALRGSEERFRSLIQNSSDMIRIIDRNGKIAYSSPSTLRIVGYEPTALAGRDPFDFIHPDDRERVRAAIGEVFDGTNPGIPTEYRVQHADGHYIDVETVGLNLLEVPSVNGIVTTLRPITERKRAEQALRESEERYRTIFDAAGDAILLMSDVCLDCNRKLQDLFGYSYEEITGHRPEDFSPPLQPDGRNSQKTAREYVQAARDGSPQSFPWVFRRKDGALIETEVSLRAVMLIKEPLLVVMIHDVTGLNRATLETRRLASFTLSGPDPVIEFTTGKECTYANPAAYTALKGLGMPDNPAAFLPEDTKAIIGLLETDPSRPICREVAVGDNLFWETITFAPESGAVRIYARDITDRARITNSLEQANRKLNLLSSITRHDIKNKLTGVLGYLELSQGSTQDKTLLEYLKRVETSANAVRKQIEFTKEYENLGIKSAAWQEITPLIQEITTQLAMGKVQVVDETNGLAIWADPMLIKIVHNLMDNSLEHGEHVSRIRFGVQAGAESVTLVYEDDGVGIPADNKEKCFNRTPRSDAGIGLFLVREILSITGITITETGVPGQGVRFEISVPRGKFRMNPKD
jgi:PAS domain S-box-containing protein